MKKPVIIGIAGGSASGKPLLHKSFMTALKDAIQLELLN